MRGTVALAVPAQPLFAWGFGVPKPGSIDPSAVEPAPVQASPSGAATPSAVPLRLLPRARLLLHRLLRALLMLRIQAISEGCAEVGFRLQSSVVQSFSPLVSSVVAKGQPCGGDPVASFSGIPAYFDAAGVWHY